MCRAGPFLGAFYDTGMSSLSCPQWRQAGQVGFGGDPTGILTPGITRGVNVLINVNLNTVPLMLITQYNGQSRGLLEAKVSYTRQPNSWLQFPADLSTAGFFKRCAAHCTTDITDVSWKLKWPASQLIFKISSKIKHFKIFLHVKCCVNTVLILVFTHRNTLSPCRPRGQMNRSTCYSRRKPEMWSRAGTPCRHTDMLEKRKKELSLNGWLEQRKSRKLDYAHCTFICPRAHNSRDCNSSRTRNLPSTSTHLLKCTFKYWVSNLLLKFADTNQPTNRMGYR